MRIGSDYVENLEFNTLLLFHKCTRCDIFLPTECIIPLYLQ